MFTMTKIQLQIESLFSKFLLMLVNPNDPNVIVKKWPTIWEENQDPNLFVLGRQHNRSYKGKLTFFYFH